MILSLRLRHRRMFAVIGCLLPIVFVVGIAARKPVPNVAQLPPELTGQTIESGARVWERSDLFPKVAVSIRLNQTPNGAFTISCTANGNFAKPDLIVYWANGTPSKQDVLPDDATLLGAFSAGALRLPANAAERDGVLLLFSLADQEIVAVSQPIRFNAATK